MGLLNLGPSTSSFFCEKEERSKRSNGERKMQVKFPASTFKKNRHSRLVPLPTRQTLPSMTLPRLLIFP